MRRFLSTEFGMIAISFLGIFSLYMLNGIGIKLGSCTFPTETSASSNMILICGLNFVYIIIFILLVTLGILAFKKRLK
jgi:hypothetical protein